MKPYHANMRVTGRRQILQTALLLGVAPALYAADSARPGLYVAPNGNDSHPGTQTQPFATIGHAATVARAGDTVWIAPGLYKPTGIIAPANSGTPEAPITFRALGGGEVVIDGEMKLPPQPSRRTKAKVGFGLVNLEGKSWIILDGLRVINSLGPGIQARHCSDITVQNCTTQNTWASGLIAARSTRIKLLHNTVKQACVDPGSPRRNTDECITVASVDTFEIAYNTVSDRMQDSSNGGEGINAKNACRNGTIHHNVVYDLIRLGIYCDAYERDLANVEVYANTVYRCHKGIVIVSEEGATVRGVSVHDNIIYDCTHAGIQLAGYLRDGPLQDIAVYHNTITRCGLSPDAPKHEGVGLLINARNRANKNFNVRNNIVAGNGDQIRTADQPYLALERNLVHGPSAALGMQAIQADPRFVNAAANDFRLLGDSPALRAAIGQPNSPFDQMDQKRPLTAADLGALQRTASATY